MNDTELTHHLIRRLARMSDQTAWHAGLNPAQRSTLEYLARANRFSRRPSHVADFLGSTRGTVSQTLKALMSKGYVSESKNLEDRRATSFDVTPEGHALLAKADILTQALKDMPQEVTAQLKDGLQRVLQASVAKNDQKRFGLCHTCHHFSEEGSGGHCGLLNLALDREETSRICHEFTEPA